MKWLAFLSVGISCLIYSDRNVLTDERPVKPARGMKGIVVEKTNQRELTETELEQRLNRDLKPGMTEQEVLSILKPRDKRPFYFSMHMLANLYRIDDRENQFVIVSWQRKKQALKLISWEVCADSLGDLFR
ncbi:hypothetical protein Pan153_62540 [Gimesia panareensis]|uniref:Uncharacterized protein n=1 Tax=Gimesia panareensis TaxID=2527978 RepID=A0A518FZ80_9PLAN|nr:hypothetical protein [Gimesia panareensis]QDV21564.1 hypothetical protein Pan153_62540 [Gimesia panareensis]